MSITNSLTPYTGSIPDRSNDTPTAFADNVYNFTLWIDSYFAKELTPITDEVNVTLQTMQQNVAQVSSDANTANTAMNEAISMKNDVSIIKHDIEEIEIHIIGINDGIDSAISDAVNSQLGEFTDKINKNTIRRKMQNFGIGLNL